MSRPLRLAFRALGACTRGAAAVEFAIVSGIFIMLLLGILEFGRALYAQSQIAFLADQAVRRVLMDPDVSSAALESALRDQFTAGNPEALAIQITSESAGNMTYRVVRIDFPFALLVPNLASDLLTLGVDRRVPAG
jgi:Flp pilus assembly protein TadG